MNITYIEYKYIVIKVHHSGLWGNRHEEQKQKRVNMFELQYKTPFILYIYTNMTCSAQCFHNEPTVVHQTMYDPSNLSPNTHTSLRYQLNYYSHMVCAQSHTFLNVQFV